MEEGRIPDPDVRLLASVATQLEAGRNSEDATWSGSPFNWIRKLPSRSSGAIFEQLVSGFFSQQGFEVRRSPDSDADRIIGGLRTEIKGSTLWANGSYRFQQLRDQDYAIAICLGISPYDAHCWVIPKSAIMEGIDILDGLTHQHGGRGGTDTAWLGVHPDNIQSWLSPYGGTLQQATQALESFVA